MSRLREQDLGRRHEDHRHHRMASHPYVKAALGKPFLELTA
jgi:hypothetical protein